MTETYESVLDVSNARMGDLPEIDELLRRYGRPQPADLAAMRLRVCWDVGEHGVADLWDLREHIEEINAELNAYGIPELPKPAKVEI